MELEKAAEIAERTVELLRPHCIRIEIAGSIRRKKPEVKDIEIVAIPKPYGHGIFADGIAAVCNEWVKVKGELEYEKCKYTQRILPEGIALDLFLVEPGNWGLLFATRTGPADYSHKVLAAGWVARGYHSKGGYLYAGHKRYEHPEEIDLFNRVGIPWISPELRSV